MNSMNSMNNEEITDDINNITQWNKNRQKIIIGENIDDNNNPNENSESRNSIDQQNMNNQQGSKNYANQLNVNEQSAIIPYNDLNIRNFSFF